MSSIEKFVNRLMNDSPAPAERSDRGSVGTTPAPKADISASTAPQVDIDIAQLHALGMLTPNETRSQIAEEYRAIKRPLLKNAFAASSAQHALPNLIMVTSAIPGEGKSFTSVNLAMSIAMELDHTVLLVEADLTKPAVARYLGLNTQQRGLVDYLIDDQVALDEVILRTNIPKLTLLRSGRSHARAAELLASQSMRRLTEELAQRYADRIVIFDAPPVLASNEAAVLSTLVGQIVMVVEHGRTPQSVVNDAINQLDREKFVGVVLNKTPQGVNQNYGYGYTEHKERDTGSNSR